MRITVRVGKEVLNLAIELELELKMTLVDAASHHKLSKITRIAMLVLIAMKCTVLI